VENYLLVAMSALMRRKTREVAEFA